jgi:hypothetical protein
MWVLGWLQLYRGFEIDFFLYFFVPFCDAVSGGCSWFGWWEGSAGDSGSKKCRRLFFAVNGESNRVQAIPLCWKNWGFPF